MNDAMTPYKPDWREARDRMADWWAGKLIDRVPALLRAPSSTPPERKRITSLPDRWIDPDTIFHNLEVDLERWYWGGEAFPWYWPYLGPMFSAAFLGCTPKFQTNTTWYERPEGLTWDRADELSFDPDNRWWRLVQELTRRAVAESGGRYLVAIGPAIGAALDLMCELFGSEETMIAMIERPDAVKRMRDRMVEWGRETYDTLDGIIAPHQQGTFTGMFMWAPDRSRVTQVDMCVMISPDMFRDFAVQDIRGLTDHVDQGIYHLDGEGELKHLDQILAIDSVRAVQWVPITKPSDKVVRDPLPWTDLFARIQEAGKKVIVLTPPERVAPLLDKIDRRNVFLWVFGCKSEDEAWAVQRTIERKGV